LTVARIVPIPLGITKAFLVKEQGAVLIDTGCPNDEKRIVAALEEENVAPQDLRLILHTHGHYDHCGSTHKLKEITAAPAAIHRQDVHLIERGTSDPLKPIRLGARLVRLISYRSFLPVKPDLLIDHEMDLGPYGVRGRVVFTPGHTAGSISVLLEGGQAIAGDLMMGGYLGGYLFPERPGYHYFADDVATLHKSMQKLMDNGATTVFVAHGGPLKRQAILDRFKLE
jgi:glyoxylase-like metal-dependent hydrolase (beta-lactamase superfamily II)